MPSTSILSLRSASSRRLQSRLRLRPLEDRAVPAAFTVNSLADAGAGAGTSGDLRFCIEQANDELNFPGPDTISFAVTGTITLSKQLQIFTSLTVSGPGADKLTVSGNNKNRVFFIDDGGVAKIDVTLSGMTITDGKASGADFAGGGVYFTDETLTLQNCLISNNSADKRGGGVYSFGYGDLIVRGCTISGNKANAGNGGGIYNYGSPDILIENSTITGNSATVSGGGLNIGYWIAPGTLTVRNSTITGNSAGSTSAFGGGGGIRVNPYYASAPNITVVSSVVSGNSNGTNAPDIRAKVVDLSNSAVGSASGFKLGVDSKNLPFGPFAALNLGPLQNNGGPMPTQLPGGGPLIDAGANPAGLTVDQRGFVRVVGKAADIGAVEASPPEVQHALISVPPIATPGGTPNSVSVNYFDLQTAINVGTIDVNDIFILAPDGLTKLPVTAAAVDINTNGTPRVGTYTFAIPGGSWDNTDAGIYTVVQNAGEVFDLDTPTPTSAKGETLGTFAVIIPSVYTVDITADEDDGNTSKGDLSLREALKLANATPGAADTVNFDPAVFATQKTILLTLGQLFVTDGVTIAGPAARVVLDGNAAGRVLNIDVPGNAGEVVNLSNLVITNGKTAGTTIADRGGGIFIQNEAVSLTNCLVTKNTSEATGGGIYVRGDQPPTNPGKLVLQDCVVDQNSSTGVFAARVGSGGGITLDLAGNLVVRRSTISGNTASGIGGGVYFFLRGSMDIADSTISNNTAASKTPLNTQGQGGGGGGGIYFYYGATGPLSITNTTISGNKALTGAGGGIQLGFPYLNPLQISNSTITGNEAATSGGGIGVVYYDLLPQMLSLSSTIVAGNKAATGTDIGIDIGATTVPGNNNLIGAADDGNATFTGTGNLSGTAATPLDPQLDPLAANGGPTQTHALKSGSPAINAGNNVLSLTTDQRGFQRVVGPAADMGAFEFGAAGATPPTVTSVKVNGAGVQRSMVTSVVVTFSEAVSFPSGINGAFQLARIAPQPTGGPSAGAPIGLVNTSAVQAGNQVTITFAGGGAVPIDLAGSLIDGNYQLTIVASKVTGAGGNLDGDGNGTGGDNFQTPASGAGRITRLFGDSDGDGDVDAVDYGAFRGAFGTANPTFDFDGDGDVDAIDYGSHFRPRFGVSVP